MLAVADPNAQGCDVHFTRGFGHYAVNDNVTRNSHDTRHGNAGHTILSLAVSVLSIERAYRTPDPELIIFDYFLWFPLYSFATSKIKIYRTAGTLPEARYILLLRLYRNTGNKWPRSGHNHSFCRARTVFVLFLPFQIMT